MLSASLLVAAFAAGVLNGLTGLGLALVGVTLLLLVYEPGRSRRSYGSALGVRQRGGVRDSWREVDRRVVRALLAPALLGMGAGTGILQVVRPGYIQLGWVCWWRPRPLCSSATTSACRGRDAVESRVRRLGERGALYLRRPLRPPDSASDRWRP